MTPKFNLTHHGHHELHHPWVYVLRYLDHHSDNPNQYQVRITLIDIVILSPIEYHLLLILSNLAGDSITQAQQPNTSKKRKEAPPPTAKGIAQFVAIC